MVTCKEAAEGMSLLAKAINGNGKYFKQQEIHEYCMNTRCKDCKLKGKFDEDPEHCILISEATEAELDIALELIAKEEK